jgi:hypothetical protein
MSRECSPTLRGRSERRVSAMTRRGRPTAAAALLAPLRRWLRGPGALPAEPAAVPITPSLSDGVATDPTEVASPPLAAPPADLPVAPPSDHSDQSAALARVMAGFAPARALLGATPGGAAGTGTLVGEIRRSGAVPILVVTPPGGSVDGIAAAAAALIPVMQMESRGRDLSPVRQLTVHGPRGGLVLTACGRGGPGARLLATGTTRTATLALLERVARQVAAAEAAEDAPGVTASAREAPDPGDRLLPFEPPWQLAYLGNHLDALGPLSLTSLRTERGDLEVDLFLPVGAPAESFARLARAVLEAVETPAVGGVDAVESVVLRLDTQRLFLRPARVAGRTVLVVAGSPHVDRPGLAARQVARATARLGAA